MSEAQMTIKKTLAVLQSAYPGKFSVSNELADIWYCSLSQFKPSTISAACEYIVNVYEWPPALATMRKHCVDIEHGVLKAPAPAEAWDMVVRYSRDQIELEQLTAEMQKALHHVGGTWAIKRDENPGYMRSQFMKAYESYLKRLEIKRITPPGVLSVIQKNRPQLAAGTQNNTNILPEASDFAHGGLPVEDTDEATMMGQEELNSLLESTKAMLSMPPEWDKEDGNGTV